MFHYEYKDNTNIIVTTEIDTIAIELLPNQAPITVKIFLRHIDEEGCNYFTFYRDANTKDQKSDNVKIEVIQSGLGFNQHPDGLPPILHKSTKELTSSI